MAEKGLPTGQAVMIAVGQGAFSGLCALVLNKLLGPIFEHFLLPIGVKQRVEDLLHAAKRLDDIIHDLNQFNPLPSSQQFKGWQSRAEECSTSAKKIETKYNGCFCLSLWTVCSLGREVDSLLKKCIDLADRGQKFLEEVKSRPQVCNVRTEDPKSLLGIGSHEEKLQEFIDGDNTPCPFLGICGMGGTGKTALLSYLHKKYAVNKKFNHVIFVHAGRDVSPTKIQDAIFVSIGLPLDSDKVTQSGTLYNHLKNRNFLLLIDEVWSPCTSQMLIDIGVPVPSKPTKPRQRIVFTTRDLGTSAEMGCMSPIHLECLSKVDAWNVFTEKLGQDLSEGTSEYEVAEKIVDECGGLPRALCTIAEVMSTMTDPFEWDFVLDCLKNSKTHTIRNLDCNLFHRLKWSYDDLTDTLKQRFLVCSLWPEEENIPREKLIIWWIGLGLLDPCDIKDGNHSISLLVRSSLLENGHTDMYSTESTYFRMHPVIRKMALWIGNGQFLPHSSCREFGLKAEKWPAVQKAWVSPSDSDSNGWSTSTLFSELTMLVARHRFAYDIVPRFEKLVFLDFEGASLDEFPVEICKLKTLQYINLSSTSVDKIPMELKNLSNLRCLYVRNTGVLQTVPEGLLPSLKELCVLGMFCSGTITAKVHYVPRLLDELKKNRLLVMLGVSIQTKSDIAKLGQLNISIRSLCMYKFEDDGQMESIDLRMLCRLKKVSELAIVNCSELKELKAEWSSTYHDMLLKDLAYFELRDLPKLQKVSLKNNRIANIRVVNISHCMKLKNVNWIGQLCSLRDLTITYCQEMEQIIDKDVVANQTGKTLGRLQRLYLEQLPQLSVICEEALQFKNLTYIFVHDCEKLKFIRASPRNCNRKINLDCSKDWWSNIAQEDQQLMKTCFQTNLRQ